MSEFRTVSKKGAGQPHVKHAPLCNAVTRFVAEFEHWGGQRGAGGEDDVLTALRISALNKGRWPPFLTFSCMAASL